MLSGALAVAKVHRQVMIVRVQGMSSSACRVASLSTSSRAVLTATYLHDSKNGLLEVNTYTRSLAGERVFEPSTYPLARIARDDVLAELPMPAVSADGGAVELPPKAFAKFAAHSAAMQRAYESMFSGLAARQR